MRRAIVVAVGAALCAALAVMVGTGDVMEGVTNREPERAERKLGSVAAHLGVKLGGIVEVAGTATQRSDQRQLAQTEELDFDESVARVVAMKYKPLLTEAEREQRQIWLSDVVMLERAADELLRAEPGMRPRDDLERRIELVGYLATAVGWEDNPGLDHALANVQRVVLSDNYHHVDDNEWLKKSLAGDKVELVLAMAAHQPDELRELVAEARRGSNAKLVAYALQHVETYRLRADD